MGRAMKVAILAALPDPTCPTCGSSLLTIQTAESPPMTAEPLTAEGIGCQYCWADPRYTKITDDVLRRCPVCGADYTGPRRPNLLATLDAQRREGEGLRAAAVAMCNLWFAENA